MRPGVLVEEAGGKPSPPGSRVSTTADNTDNSRSVGAGTPGSLICCLHDYEGESNAPIVIIIMQGFEAGEGDLCGNLVLSTFFDCAAQCPENLHWARLRIVFLPYKNGWIYWKEGVQSCRRRLKVYPAR
jgi:hypothetical protein